MGQTPGAGAVTEPPPFLTSPARSVRLPASTMRLGSLKIHLVSDGGFRLDGGAMFGVVPKVLWSRQSPADERNRIRMGTNCLLIETGDDLVLIDTGLGDKGDEKFSDIFGLEAGAERLPESIERRGFALSDVTQVVLTHLHFDHCGWNTRRDGDGWVPTFSNATYWIERGELHHAQNPSARDRASYDVRNWDALLAAGLVKLHDGDARPASGTRIIKAPGHNADMCLVLLDGGDEERGIFFADLVPTTAHLPYPWVMGYDLYPLQTMEHKELWLPRASAGNWLCIFEHDPDTPWGRLEEHKPGRFAVRRVDEVGSAANS